MEYRAKTDCFIDPDDTSTVYITCVSQYAEFKDVVDLFKQAGNLLYLYLYKKEDTNLPCFGYAMYRYEAEAKNAVELFDYRVFHDRVLRVTFPEAEDRAHKTNTNGCPKVSFTNANMAITEAELRKRFKKIGHFVNFEIHCYESEEYIEGAEIRANGVVTFEDEETAKLAIEKLNHLTINDICMYVDSYISEIDRKAKEEEMKIERLRRTVVVKNFSSDSCVLSFCEKIGTVTRFTVESDEDENSSECHVTFQDIGEVQFAIQEMNKILDGKKFWSAGWALTRSELNEKMEKYDVGRNSYIVVKNLDELVSHKHLWQMFSSFGEVIFCKVELDHHGISNGTGYVSFAYSKDATGAVNGMNGKIIGKKKCLSVTFDESKADKSNRVCDDW